MAVIRTFIAIHLTPALLAGLQQAQDSLRASPGGPAGRWVPLSNIHLTLKFLGDVDSARLPEIYAATDDVAAAHPPLTLSLHGMGCFPNARQPRIVWAGVSEAGGQLEHLAEQLDSALGRLGWPRETRPFRAHLTLARVNEHATHAQTEALGQAAMAYRLAEHTMVAHEVAVVRSDLRPQGPLYSDLHVARLAAPTR